MKRAASCSSEPLRSPLMAALNACSAVGQSSARNASTPAFAGPFVKNGSSHALSNATGLPSIFATGPDGTTSALSSSCPSARGPIVRPTQIAPLKINERERGPTFKEYGAPPKGQETAYSRASR